MAIVTGQTTRAKRGLGSRTRGVKHARLDWTAADNETITPGSGGVPYGVVALAWEPDADNENANAFWNSSTGLGTIAASGSYGGYLHVWYNRS